MVGRVKSVVRAAKDLDGREEWEPSRRVDSHQKRHFWGADPLARFWCRKEQAEGVGCVWRRGSTEALRCACLRPWISRCVVSKTNAENDSLFFAECGFGTSTEKKSPCKKILAAVVKSDRCCGGPLVQSWTWTTQYWIDFSLLFLALVCLRAIARDPPASLRCWRSDASAVVSHPFAEVRCSRVHGRVSVGSARRVRPRRDADQRPGVVSVPSAHEGAATVALRVRERYMKVKHSKNMEQTLTYAHAWTELETARSSRQSGG